MVVSIFGESNVDKRDYGFAFGAFKGAAYLALVLACKGLLSPLDAKEFGRMMLDGIDIVPDDQLSSMGREAIVETLNDIEQMAVMNFKPGA
jgi:hypothetical protein